MGCLSRVESLEADTARREILDTEVGRNFGKGEIREDLLVGRGPIQRGA